LPLEKIEKEKIGEEGTIRPSQMMDDQVPPIIKGDDQIRRKGKREELRPLHYAGQGKEKKEYKIVPSDVSKADEVRTAQRFKKKAEGKLAKISLQYATGRLHEKGKTFERPPEEIGKSANACRIGR